MPTNNRFYRRSKYNGFLLFSILLSINILINDLVVCSEQKSDLSEIKNIKISGNKFLDDEIILETFVTKETPGAISKALYGIFGEKFGRKSEYFNQEVFETDIERLKQIYSDNGFFNIKLNQDIKYNLDSSIVEIHLHIYEDNRSFIDTIEYVGLNDVNKRVIEEIFKKSIVKQGSPYQKSKVNDEAVRILEILNNYGYPYAKIIYENSSRVRYYSTNNFKIVYAFDTGEKYQYGEIKVYVEPVRKDITDNVVLKQLEFKEGELISREKIISSEKNLNRLGIFETARIDILERELSEPPYKLPVNIFTKARNKHELAPEVIVSDEDNLFNLGLGAGYTNRNFFGDARNFNMRLRFSTQAIHEWNIKQLFEKNGLEDPTILGKAEIQFQIIQPYIFTRALNGSWTLSFSADKKNFYVVTLIRNKIGLVNQFATYTTGFAEWILERSNVNWLEDTLKTGLSLERLRQEEQPQFNSIISFTLQRDKTDDIFSPSSGFFHAVSVEESGIFQRILRNIQPSLPFTEFYKITVFGRWYKDLSRTKFNIFALKLKVGYQEKYGSSKKDEKVHIPLNRRFFAGGSGSIRGWKSRSLGAMSPVELALGGNFLFEGNTELRINHFRGFGKLWFLEMQNFWAVYFLDYGNLWRNLDEFRIKDIAVASGFGLRYDTFIGPVRFDFGFRIYDPAEQSGKMWFYEKKFFKEVISNGVLNFGIGHAF